MLALGCTTGGSSGGGETKGGSEVAGTTGKGLGCACATTADCAKPFCSDFLVCTTNDSVECQQDTDCGCNAKCVVDGPKRTCQIPCSAPADCPGKLQCAALATAWTTASGATLAKGCVAPAATSGVTWEKDIRPIVTAACAGCHLGGGKSGEVKFDTYADTQVTMTNCGPSATVATLMAGKVSPTPPCGSRMPLTGGPLSDAQVKLFADWVAGGALEK